MLVEPAEQLIGRLVDDVLPPETALLVRQAIAQTLAAGSVQQFEYAVERRQQKRWYSARVVPFGSPDDPCVLWVARDVTQHHRTLDSLRTTEARLAEAQRIGRIGSWDWNVVTGEVWWSAQLYHLFGVEPGRFQASYDAFLDLVVAEDRPLLQARVAATLERGEPFVAEYRVRRSDGVSLLLASQAELQRDQAGQPLRLIGSVQDITEQRRIQIQARRVEQLASIGTLATSIAHEINNPISAAWAAAAAALAVKGRPQAAEVLDECLKTISNSLQRCQLVIRNVLRIAGRQPLQREPQDLHAIVGQAVESTRHYASLRGATIEQEPAAVEARTLANGAEIEQVLVNLIRNAIDAEATRITVGTQENVHSLRISVRDNGKGIPPEDLEQLFDPFFGHSASPANTGLGLAISHKIIIDHGGHIDVESRPGTGTVMTISLPSTLSP